MTFAWTWLGAALAVLSVFTACASDDAGGDGLGYGNPTGSGGSSAGGRMSQPQAGAVGAPQSGSSSASGGTGASPPPVMPSHGGYAGDDPEIVGGGPSGVTAAGGAGGEAPVLNPQPACQLLDAGAAGEGSGGLVVKLKANTNDSSAFTQGEVQVTNEGSADLQLNALELRYYFESEYRPEQTDKLIVRVDHARKSGLVPTNIAQQVVTTDVVVIDPAIPGADAYILIAFAGVRGDAGMLLSGETVIVQFRIEPPEDSYYSVSRDQTNDYSFGACSQYASPWPRIVLLSDGDVVSGAPPAGLPGRPTGGGGAGGAGGEPGFAGSDVIGGAGGGW